MTDRDTTDSTVTHATFTLERAYAAPPARVFAAWSDPSAKGSWFAGPAHTYELDFRVGGTELNRGSLPDGTVMTFASVYHDIVPDRRVVYGSTLHGGEALATASLTTVEFEADGDGTRLILTEQGSYLDGHEKPEWREQGTGDWLDALGAYLAGTGEGAAG
ncbi:SRPBCC family protein [Streptomyces sp. NBC_01498]|uniref:SRPBCC family protein n=1 Tax=Streptomyces sp. NBC_01498 TaxID=2975870 RepID=UPI002E7BB9B0|nr:SRPBCC family protein [Streptomyces sp. NBC_01498]WTL28189.1 SRPBCC family protein [Streptomyces sp. NBC_01498]